MDETPITNPLQNIDHCAMLQALIDSTIQHLKEQHSRFRACWEKLESDQNYYLEATSLVIRPTNPARFEISVAADSSSVVLMWAFCLTTRMAYLNDPACQIRTFPKNVLITMHSYVDSTLGFISPLLHRTQFALHEIDSTVNYPTTITNTINAEQNLICDVLKQRDCELDRLLSYLENIKKSTNHRIGAIHDSSGDIELLIGSSSPNELCMWSACLSTARTKLNIPDVRTRQTWKVFEITIGKMYIPRIIEYLMPIVHKTYFETLEFRNVPAEIINFFTLTFGTNCVKKLSFIADRCAEMVDFKSWVAFIRKVRPRSTIHHLLDLPHEMHEFVYPLAELVKDIELFERDGGRIPISISVVRDILDRKCSNLIVNGEITTLSLADVEGLVQYLHHMDKRISLKIPTEMEDIKRPSTRKRKGVTDRQNSDRAHTSGLKWGPPKHGDGIFRLVQKSFSFELQAPSTFGVEKVDIPE